MSALGEKRKITGLQVDNFIYLGSEVNSGGKTERSMLSV
jgi:hypothetical protein